MVYGVWCYYIFAGPQSQRDPCNPFGGAPLFVVLVNANRPCQESEMTPAPAVGARPIPTHPGLYGRSPPVSTRPVLYGCTSMAKRPMTQQPFTFMVQVVEVELRRR